MNQLSLFEQNETKLEIYEVLDLHELPYEIGKYELIKVYHGHGYFCYVKTTCGKLVHMFVSKARSDHHCVLVVYQNLREVYIEQLLSKIETEYAEGVKT